MNNRLAASERRGILAVAGIALMISAAGWIVSLCRRPAAKDVPPEVEVLVHEDSTGAHGPVKEVGKKKRRSSKDSVGNKKTSTPRQYRRRSPLDEKV